MFVEALFNEDGCLMQLPPPLPPKKTPHNLVFILNQSRRTIEFVRQTPRITAEKGYSFIKCDFFFPFLSGDIRRFAYFTIVPPRSLLALAARPPLGLF